MRKSMILCDDNGVKGHYVCPYCKQLSFKDKLNVNIVPMFTSSLHAYKHGWRYTTDITYCPPNPDDKGCWVCPDCWEEDR